MRFDWKKALTAVLRAALLMFSLGGLWLTVFLFGALGAFPIYITKTIPAVGAASTLAAIAAATEYLPPKALRWLGRGVLAVWAAAFVYVAWGWYNDHVPTLDDRTLLLREYEPFTEDTKAVSLDHPASFQMDAAAVRRLRLDGATALYPVYAAFVQAVYPEGAYPVYDSRFHGSGLVACNGTVEAYERLIAGSADLIFAAAPSQDQLELAAEAGKELHLTPIGREAFVFFVNSKNPVTDLTVEEIRGIYSGEITNWRQVGGSFQSIRPFQRAENSGSQSALLRLMGDTPLLEPEEREVIGAMDGIIREVASYRNYRNAIGFSFRFYATEMVSSNQIRLLSLNGAAPDWESIRNGSYPIASEFYAVTASPIGRPAPEERDEDLAAFLAWICSQEGQELVELTGYVGVGS